MEVEDPRRLERLTVAGAAAALDAAASVVSNIRSCGEEAFIIIQVS